MTWYRLMIWKREIEKTKREGLEKANQYSNNEKLSEYYLHIAEVAEHQLSLLERLIQEAIEEENIRNQEKENKNAETNN